MIILPIPCRSDFPKYGNIYHVILVIGGTFMANYSFPAIFSADDEDEGYTVTFPDFDGCI